MGCDIRMEKAYSYDCTFDPDMHSKFSIEFCTSDKEMYLKVKQIVDLVLAGVLDLTADDYIPVKAGSELIIEN